MGALPSPSLRCIHRSACESFYGFSACVESALSEQRDQGLALHRNVKYFKHWRWWTEWGMFMWLEKVCDICPHNKQLESSWDELFRLCPAVWCSFVLVIAGIEVPSSRTACSSAASGCTAHAILVVVSSCAAVKAWNGVLLNLCGHSQSKLEVKHEIRGLSIWHFIEVQGLEHPAWSALCSPHFGVSVL